MTHPDGVHDDSVPFMLASEAGWACLLTSSERWPGGVQGGTQVAQEEAQ